MADEVLILDAAGSMPDGSDPGAPTNSPLSIGPGTSYPLTEASFPAPPLNVLYSSSIDVEGELPVSRRFGNRTITLKIEMDEASATNTLLDALQVKFAKLAREGGTLKRTRKDGTTVRIYDIVAADGWDPVYDLKYLLGHSSEVVMTLPARPLARGAEVDLGDNIETVLPCLIFTDTGVTGDVPGLGRLVIDNDATVDQRWVVWGIQSRYYDAASSAALFYEAEGRTALGGAATAVGPTGASGTGSNVMRHTALSNVPLAMLSTQASGAGAHLSHVGSFRVFARAQAPATNVGSVSLAFEWARGDYRQVALNATTTLDAAWEGTWRIVDLGLVSIGKVLTGTQSWEGRVLAWSTAAGDDIDLDWLLLVPADEGSGQASASFNLPAPATYIARDEFDATVGAVTGTTAPVGGVWVGGGDVDDFIDDGFDRVNRTAVSDINVNTGRYAALGSAASTAQVVQIDYQTSAFNTNLAGGVLARYTDANNNVIAGFQTDSSSVARFWVRKRVAGVATDLFFTPAGLASVISTNTFYRVRFYVDAGGRWFLWVYTPGGLPGTPVAAGVDTTLATAGTLAAGRPGIYDYNGNPGAATRTFNDFAAWVPSPDAAIYAAQSLVVRHDGVLREDSAGTLWCPVGAYEGDYLRVPVSGAEARTVRVVVKESRAVPGQGADGGTDALSARLFMTPLYL